METKPGYLTTEFWVTIIVQLVGIFNLMFPVYHISDKTALGAQTLAAAAYAISRGLAKQGVKPD